MDISLLRSFLAVCDTQSFSAAAQRLNVTQSTISHQVSRLEDRLGVQLLSRTTRRCELTREGRDLVAHAQRILREVEAMEEKFRPSTIQGRVVIGVPDDYYLFGTMTEAIRGFMAARPNVVVEMRAGLAIDHQRALRDGVLDLAVMRDVGQIPANALRAEQLVWIAAESWQPHDDGVVPLALVGGGGGCSFRRSAIEVLDQARIPWRCNFTCTSLEGVLSVVRAGLAISVVPDGERPPGTRAIEVDARLPRLPQSSLTIRFSDEKEPTLAARALARTMTEALMRM